MSRGKWLKAAHFLSAAGLFSFIVAWPAMAMAAANAGAVVPIARFETPILSLGAGRLVNVEKAAQKISGISVGSGEIFSFNAALGPRTAALGWQPAPELYLGDYVMGYGGGICQVSSTLYTAVLLAGLAVVERHHHSRPLSYIPLGLDATVAWDYLDFKFRNSRPEPITIEANIVKGIPNRIAVTVYGQGSPPVSEIESVTERYLPPAYHEVLDPALPAGHRAIADQGYEGYDVRVYRIRAGRRQPVGQAYYPPGSGYVVVGTGGMRPDPFFAPTRFR